MVRFRLALWVGLWVWSAYTAGLAHAQNPVGTAPEPVKVFFKPDDIDEVSWSPSGRWLAFAMARHDKSQGHGLFVLDLHAQTPVLGGAAAFANADVHTVRWVNDDWLVFSIGDRQTASGEKRRWPGLFSVKRDGSEQRMLVRTREAEA